MDCGRPRRSAREFPVSQTVQDVIAERVERIPEELGEILITVAVAGGRLPSRMLSHVHGISRLHAAAACDALVDRQLLVEEGGAIGAHPVIAHVVRDGISPARRPECHRAVAVALELATHEVRIAAGRSPATRIGAANPAWPTATRRPAASGGGALSPTRRRSPGWTWQRPRRGERSRSEAVDVLTADVMERAGLSEAPRTSGPLPVTREIVSEDLDLRVRG